MPKDFSQDGAYGASGGGSGVGSTSIPQAPGSGGTQAQQFLDRTGYSPLYVGAAGANPYNPGRAGDTSSGVDYTSEASIKASPGTRTYAAGDMSNPEYYMFDDGGEVEPGDGYDTGTDQQVGPDYNSALKTVQDALNYGRNLHGLTRTAANMPAAPGGQSDTGVQPLRPGPGTLAPAANPFGKRLVPPPKTAQNEPQQGIPDADGDFDGDEEAA